MSYISYVCEFPNIATTISLKFSSIKKQHNSNNYSPKYGKYVTLLTFLELSVLITFYLLPKNNL